MSSDELPTEQIPHPSSVTDMAHGGVESPTAEVPRDTPHEDRTAPRSAEDKAWEHPADGGELIGGDDFYYHLEAFGLFQENEEFADDLAQALRRVSEKLFRAGFRDWETENDYIDCTYWFLRRNLEVNAREVFRLWYGDAEWHEPFRTACRLQEVGEVEYRIDHLLTSELQVEVRVQRAAEKPVAKPFREARYGELPRDLRNRASEFMAPGEFLNLNDISARLQAMVEYRVDETSLSQTLNRLGTRFDKKLEYTEKGTLRAYFALLE